MTQGDFKIYQRFFGKILRLLKADSRISVLTKNVKVWLSKYRKSIIISANEVIAFNPACFLCMRVKVAINVRKKFMANGLTRTKLTDAQIAKFQSRKMMDACTCNAHNANMNGAGFVVHD